MPSVPSNELIEYAYRHLANTLLEVNIAYTGGRFTRQSLQDSIAAVVNSPVLKMHPSTSDGEWFCGIEFRTQNTTTELVFPWQSPIDPPDGPCAIVRMYSKQALQDRPTNTLLRRIARQLRTDRHYENF